MISSRYSDYQLGEPRNRVQKRRRRSIMMVSRDDVQEQSRTSILAINVGTRKATTSDESKYFTLDSGTNVMVSPLVKHDR